MIGCIRLHIQNEADSTTWCNASRRQHNVIFLKSHPEQSEESR